MKFTPATLLLHGSAALVSLVNGAIIERQAPPISLVTPAQWNQLKAEVGGRLYEGVPYGRPCYTKYKGETVSVDDAACDVALEHVQDERYRIQQFGTAILTQWENCPAKGAQCGLNALDPTTKSIYNDPATCSQGSIAPYYISVQSASDVQAGFRFAEKYGVPLTIKNTGHDFAGRSHGPNTLSLWTHNLQNITRNQKFVAEGCDVSTATDAVTLGAGIHWEKAYQWAEAHNVTLLGGSCPTVGGAGGWPQGGGHGALSNVYGMGVDRVLQYKVVTPDGQLRYANACQNKDLFWAMRGGGPGTWGVSVELTYKLEPQLKLQTYAVSFAAHSTPERVRAFTKAIIANSIKLAEDGWGGYLHPDGMEFITPKLTPAQAKVSMKPIIDYIATLGNDITGINQVFELPSFYPFEANYVGPTVEAGPGLLGSTTGRLIQKKNFATETARAELLEAMLEVYARSTVASVMVTAPYSYKAVPGATSVHPGWRSAVWTVLSLNLGWAWDSSAAQLKAHFEELTAIGDILRKITPFPDAGVYVSESDVYEKDWKQAYYGGNYDALLKIKNKYDPKGLLDCWKCVGWKGANQPRYECYFS